MGTIAPGAILLGKDNVKVPIPKGVFAFQRQLVTAQSHNFSIYRYIDILAVRYQRNIGLFRSVSVIRHF